MNKEKLDKIFDSLNEEAQKKIITYAEDLMFTGKYEKNITSLKWYKEKKLKRRA